MRLQMWEQQALPCLHTLLIPLGLQHHFDTMTQNVYHSPQMAHVIVIGPMA